MDPAYGSIQDINGCWILMMEIYLKTCDSSFSNHRSDPCDPSTFPPKLPHPPRVQRDRVAFHLLRELYGLLYHTSRRSRRHQHEAIPWLGINKIFTSSLRWTKRCIYIYYYITWNGMKWMCIINGDIYIYTILYNIIYTYIYIYYILYIYIIYTYIYIYYIYIIIIIIIIIYIYTYSH